MLGSWATKGAQLCLPEKYYMFTAVHCFRPESGLQTFIHSGIQNLDTEYMYKNPWARSTALN